VLNWAELSWNWAKLSLAEFCWVELNWIELNSSSFDLSNLALDRIAWNKTETDENTRCPMGDWTSQNWTKRDGRNNQEQEQQQQEKWSLPAIAVGDFTTSCPFSSSFDMSNLALDRITWNKTETDKNTSCPMGDWAFQNWTKRDGRNNQEEQQQQEKKATYKTAAELAVKKRNWMMEIMDKGLTNSCCRNGCW
jgi:hypothetical protein